MKTLYLKTEDGYLAMARSHDSVDINIVHTALAIKFGPHSFVIKDEPTGAAAWLAAGIDKADVEIWFEGQMDIIADDPKSWADYIADSMTPDDFREEFLGDVEDDDGE